MMYRRSVSSHTWQALTRKKHSARRKTLYAVA